MATPSPTSGRWIFGVPKLNFARRWTLGAVTFVPAGEHAGEVASLVPALGPRERTWGGIVHEIVEGFDACTVEVRAATSSAAVETVRQALGVLRFLLRSVTAANVDFHRIGLPGDVDRSLLEFILIRDDQSVAPAAQRVDGPVEWTCREERLIEWDADPVVQWLGDQLSFGHELRSVAGRRALTSIAVADQAFLTRDIATKVLLSAIAVESMFSEQGDGGALRIARRVAFLSSSCSAERRDGPLCPYIAGFEPTRVWCSRG